MAAVTDGGWGDGWSDGATAYEEDECNDIYVNYFTYIYKTYLYIILNINKYGAGILKLVPSPYS